MAKAVATRGTLHSGRRETNKREKLARIRQAAKDVFSAKDEKAATVREIAAAADVAFGTLFRQPPETNRIFFCCFLTKR